MDGIQCMTVQNGAVPGAFVAKGFLVGAQVLALCPLVTGKLPVPSCLLFTPYPVIALEV